MCIITEQQIPLLRQTRKGKKVPNQIKGTLREEHVQYLHRDKVKISHFPTGSLACAQIPYFITAVQWIVLCAIGPVSLRPIMLQHPIMT